MPWARFEILSGLLGAVLILIGVVLLVQFRILRRSLKRLNARIAGLEDYSSPLSPVPPPARASGGDSQGLLEKERRRMEDLIREAERLRSDLSILFYDVQRFLDEITPEKKPSKESEKEWPEESGVMYPLPEEGESTAEPESLKEKVLRLSRKGQSIQEIALAIGRGEGEVAFLLSMERVGRS